jgi:hypothetical protein
MRAGLRVLAGFALVILCRFYYAKRGTTMLIKHKFWLCAALLAPLAAFGQAQEQVGDAVPMAPVRHEVTPVKPLAPLGSVIQNQRALLVTHPGAGAGGADESRLQNSSLLMTTFGFGAQTTSSNFIADDFVIPAGGAEVSALTFYSYQTGSSTNSSFTGITLQILDGPPNNPSSTVVFGDRKTNRFTTSTFSNVYRVSETTVGDSARPIMAVTAGGLSLNLAAGTYWFVVSLSGGLSSGPWMPPITTIGQTVTGNGMQAAGGSNWVAAADGGNAAFFQGFPVTIQGTLGGANVAPTITAASGVSQQSGSPLANRTVATVTDDAGNGTVVVTGAATVNGVTLSNIANSAGTITADVISSCTANAASFTLTATDTASATATATLNVAVPANTSPTLGNYPSASVNVGGTTTITPNAAPADNGTITSIVAATSNFTGTFSVNPASGVVTVNNAGPAGEYFVYVNATDNCGGISLTQVFELDVIVGGSDPVINPIAVTRAQGSASFFSPIATVSDAGGAGAVQVTVNGGAQANLNGVEVKQIENIAGQVRAKVRAGCFATNASFVLTANNGSNSNTANLVVNVTPGSNPNWCQWWPR